MKKRWTLDDLKKIDKLIIIDGQDRNPEEIADDYREYMREGYNLSTEEIADYLRCNYQTAHRKFTSTLRRIGITERARNILFTSEIDDEDLVPLFTKRRLYNRADFEEFLLDQAHWVITRDAYRFSDLSEDVLERLEYWAEKKELSSEAMFLNLAICTDPSHVRDESSRQVQIMEVPQKIVSMRDLLNKFGYSATAYRYIERYAIPKIKIGNLVRYNDEDFKERDDSVIFTLPVSIPKEKFLAKLGRRLMKEDIRFTIVYLDNEIRFS
ncbi:hypothetical protein [Shimazuella kribbensis]|uniref:hypothetical protein n=1 Tax=Shimazuella kribbensis TaxID=139808 RepID=UPI0004185E34|nr:hypothetical protein [Shimazuella kribbensis]